MCAFSLICNKKLKFNTVLRSVLKLLMRPYLPGRLPILHMVLIVQGMKLVPSTTILVASLLGSKFVSRGAHQLITDLAQTSPFSNVA